MAENGLQKPSVKTAEKDMRKNRSVRDRLTDDIRGKKVSGIYFLCGDDGYLRKNFRSALVNAVDYGDDMNLSVFSGTDVNTNDIISIASTIPFFADKRVVVVENSGLFALYRGALRPGAEELAEYLSELPESTVLIFNESEVDKRLKPYKAVVSAKAVIAELNHRTPGELIGWIAKKLSASGLRITSEAAEELINRAGIDMNTLENEMEKLVSFKGGAGDISLADVESISQKKLDDAIFDMMEAALSGNLKKALDYYGDLLALREPPLKLLVLMGRQCSNVLAVKDAKDYLIPDDQIIKNTGISPNAIYPMKKLSARCSREKLEKEVAYCVSLDDSIKRGDIEETLAAELMLISLAT